MWQYEGDPLCRYDTCPLKWKRKFVNYTCRITDTIETCSFMYTCLLSYGI
jgi:hypothetical protein